MLRTLTILNSSQQVVRSADKFEAKHGAKGRLLILITYPAQLLAIYVGMRLFAAISAPLRRALGYPAPAPEMRIAAAWLSLLAANGAKASAGSFSGVVFSNLDNLPVVNTLGFGAKVQMARAEALSDLELTAALAHELGHMRLRHIFIFSLAFAALAAGLPWLVRKLALSESPAQRHKRERDEAWDQDPYVPMDTGWVAATKSVIDATPREFAAAGVSVVGVALAVSAVQRCLERSADDYAASLVGSEPLISAIEAMDAVDTARNSKSGRKAAFWRADARFSRGPVGRLFASAPSSQSRIKRLRAKS